MALASVSAMWEAGLEHCHAGPLEYRGGIMKSSLVRFVMASGFAVVLGPIYPIVAQPMDAVVIGPIWKDQKSLESANASAAAQKEIPGGLESLQSCVVPRATRASVDRVPNSYAWSAVIGEGPLAGCRGVISSTQFKTVEEIAEWKQRQDEARQEKARQEKARQERERVAQERRTAGAPVGPSVGQAETINRGVLSGQLTFACGFKAEVLEVRGYTYLGKGSNRGFVTNIFGAPNARVVVTDGERKIVGVTDSNRDGLFSLAVVDSPFYELTVSFHGREVRHVVTRNKTSNIELTFGEFGDLDAIKDW
jgi:hypothetical protein